MLPAAWCTGVAQAGPVDSVMSVTSLTLLWVRSWYSAVVREFFCT